MHFSTAFSNTDYPYDKDTTPILRAVIPDPRGGGAQNPAIKFNRKSDGEAALILNSYDSVVGWKYESAPNTWVDLTVVGIPAGVVDGNNRLEITVPDELALAVQEYLVTGRMYEDRNRG